MRMFLLCWVLAACAAAQPLKVLCWNIHHGRGMDERIDLDRIAAVIAAEKPALVALQEVDRSSRRSGGVDQAAVLADKLGMKPIFGEAMEFQGGGYGLAVLSRLPVKRHQVHRLPGPGEPRIVLEVVVTRDGEDLSLACVHLDHRLESTRLAQVAAVIEALDGRERVILCGDLNDGPDSPVLKAFGEGWHRVPKRGTAATHPAPRPRVEIDHFLLRGVEAAGPLRVLDEPQASDHRPVVGTVK